MQFSEFVPKNIFTGRSTQNKFHIFKEVKCIKKSSLNWKDMIAFGRIVICFFTIKKRSHHKHTKRYAPTSQKCQRKIPFKTPRRKRVFPQKTHHSNHPCTMHPIKNPLRKVFTKKERESFQQNRTQSIWDINHSMKDVP